MQLKYLELVEDGRAMQLVASHAESIGHCVGIGPDGCALPRGGNLGLP